METNMEMAKAYGNKHGNDKDIWIYKDIRKQTWKWQGHIDNKDILKQTWKWQGHMETNMEMARTHRNKHGN